MPSPCMYSLQITPIAIVFNIVILVTLVFAHTSELADKLVWCGTYGSMILMGLMN